MQFILNEQVVETNMSHAETLLDFIRYHKQLVGTKIGCREGDCGACTVLMGELKGGKLSYKSITSCITPLGNAQGKHIVTVEGVNMFGKLNIVQDVMVSNSGTQCGFCTPGFVVSLTGYCLSESGPSLEGCISAIDGNICRCTGYKSIERACGQLVNELNSKDLQNPIQWLTDKGFIPSYFTDIKQQLEGLKNSTSESNLSSAKIVGGGTDLYVQRHDDMVNEQVALVSDYSELKGITVKDGLCRIGAANNASDLMNSKDLQTIFPRLYDHLKLVSSTQIRNIGTIAGNFVNASPIGDLTAIFIALNSSINLRNASGSERTLLLKDFYKGYKSLNKPGDEYITSVQFDIPSNNFYFNFEKVSKRKYLDIASVNTAMGIEINGDTVSNVCISAGGVGPTPMILSKTCDFLKGKELNEQTLSEALDVIPSDVSPMSDVRGSKEYKTLLLRQLVFAHFLELFPEKIGEGVLL